MCHVRSSSLRQQVRGTSSGSACASTQRCCRAPPQNGRRGGARQADGMVVSYARTMSVSYGRRSVRYTRLSLVQDKVDEEEPEDRRPLLAAARLRRRGAKGGLSRPPDSYS